MAKRQKVDILSINPGVCSEVYQKLANQFSAIETPALVAAFASHFQLHNCSVEIIDAPALNLSPQETAEAIANNYDPALIVLVVYGFQPSASTQNMVAAGQTCTALKQINSNYKIMMTGTHPAALPERTLKEENVDF